MSVLRRLAQIQVLAHGITGVGQCVLHQLRVVFERLICAPQSLADCVTEAAYATEVGERGIHHFGWSEEVELVAQFVAARECPWCAPPRTSWCSRSGVLTRCGPGSAQRGSPRTDHAGSSATRTWPRACACVTPAAARYGLCVPPPTATSPWRHPHPTAWPKESSTASWADRVVLCGAVPDRHPLGAVSEHGGSRSAAPRGVRRRLPRECTWRRGRPKNALRSRKPSLWSAAAAW